MVNPGQLAVHINLAHRGSCSETGTLDNSGLENPLLVVFTLHPPSELAARHCAHPYTGPQV